MDRFVYVELEGYSPSSVVEELNMKAPRGYRFVSLLPSRKSFYGFAALFERVEKEGFVAAIQKKEVECVAKKEEVKEEKQDGWINPIHRMNTAISPRQVGDYVRLRYPCTCGDYGKIIEVGFDGDPNVYRVEMTDGCIGMVLEKDIG
jgi:hypothetical protein